MAAGPALVDLKMSALFDYHLVLLILSISCDSVASDYNSINGTSQSHFEDFLPHFSQSKMLTGDILSILSTLNENTTLHLNLLYDQHYEETVGEITRFSKDLDGTMVFEYDDTMTTLNQLLTPFAETTLLLVLCSIRHILKIFDTVQDQRLESHQVLWLLVLEDKERQDEVILGLEGLIQEGTQVTLITKDPLQDFKVLSSHVDLDGVVRFFYMGSWNHSSESKRSHLHGLVMPDVQQQYSDMKGRKLIVAANEVIPFFIMKKVADDGTIIKPYSGFEFKVVETLSSNLNFTYRIMSSPDGNWGSLLPDGSWNGMIGMVIRREANFALSSIAISGAREKVLDFTDPYYSDPLGIASRAPKLKTKAFAILDPFTLQVWVCIIVSTLVLGPIIWLQSKLMVLYLKEEDVPTWSLQVYSFSLFRNLVLQGNVLNIIRGPHRFIFYFWYLFCLMVSASYSGMLTAVLAVPVYERPVDSLNDLPRAVREGFTLGVIKDSTNEDIFKYAEEGIYKEIWELFNHEDRDESFLSEIDVGLDKVLKEKYIFLGPISEIKSVSKSLGFNKFHFAREGFFPQSVGIACPAGAPYRKTISVIIHRLRDAGITSKWKQDDFDSVVNEVSAEGEDSVSQAITLKHLQAAFFMLVLGSLVALVTLVLEQILSFYQH